MLATDTIEEFLCTRRPSEHLEKTIVCPFSARRAAPRTSAELRRKCALPLAVVRTNFQSWFIYAIAFRKHLAIIDDPDFGVLQIQNNRLLPIRTFIK